ncbi:MAG: MBL fold metallo-hydrolase [Gorillibacterium sp.]|nr:MBL fold metallo-hydrolase [Gorillibacterium sp.]
MSTGVYAAIVETGSAAMGNAGFVDLGEEVLVFDTFNLPQAAQDLKKAVAQLIGKPIRYVVNNHWHGDHMRGNQLFDKAIIIATETTRSLMEARHPERIRKQREMLPHLVVDIASLASKIETEQDEAALRQMIQQLAFLRDIELALLELQIVLPTMVIGSSLTLFGSKRTAQIIAYEHGHTPSDLVLFLPEDGVVFTGDLLSIHNHPSLGDGGDAVHWIELLSELERLRASVIIPGHGPVGGTEALYEAKQYLNDLLELTAGIRAQKHTDVDIMPAVPLAYKDWQVEGVFQQNIRYLLESRTLQ